MLAMLEGHARPGLNRAIGTAPLEPSLSATITPGARVQLETRAFEIAGDVVAPCIKRRRFIGEQGKVMNVPQTRRAQRLDAEMNEAVETEVGEELAGQVGDR